MTSVASEAKATAQARREAELVAGADKGPRAFYAAAGYGKLGGILGGTVVIALVAQHLLRQQNFLFFALSSSGFDDPRTERKASCGISTFPTCFMRFLPSFCFSRSFLLRVMSPP